MQGERGRSVGRTAAAGVEARDRHAELAVAPCWTCLVPIASTQPLDSVNNTATPDSVNNTALPTASTTQPLDSVNNTAINNTATPSEACLLASGCCPSGEGGGGRDGAAVVGGGSREGAGTGSGATAPTGCDGWGVASAALFRGDPLCDLLLLSAASLGALALFLPAALLSPLTLLLPTLQGTRGQTVSGISE